MADDEHSDPGEAVNRPRTPAGFPEPSALSGTYLGASWRVVPDPERPRIVIDGREIHLERDSLGAFTSHLTFGRFTDPGEIARLVVRFHPDYSPLARRGRPVA
jgi:hypothetical protein